MELDQVTLNGYHRARALNDEVTQGRMRRSKRRTLDVLMETQLENEQLLRERHKLRKQHECALGLLRELLDRSEAFRRLAIHLRQAWEPTDPSELPLKASLRPLLDRKKQELASDAEWQRARDADIEQLLNEAAAVNPVKR